MRSPEVAIAFTVSGQRQSYLRETLNDWLKVRGIQDTHLIFMLEPVPERSHQFPLDAFQGWLTRNFRSSEIIQNDTRLNCLENTKAGMDAAFDWGAEFAIMCEEDVRVADDTLEYFTWADKTYREAPEIIAACAHTFRAESVAAPNTVVRAGWFNPIVWATWPGRWRDYIRPTWAGCHGNPQAWDLNLKQHIQADQKFSIFPCRSRSLHAGKTSTLNALALSEFYYEASVSTCFVPEYKTQDWTEVVAGKDLGLVV